MSDVSEQALLDYFSAGGNSGKVRNADILKTFKPFIGHSDPQLRAKYREEFKLIIDRIAVVKSENGEKFLFLKKKYRQLLQERGGRADMMDVAEQRHSSPSRTLAVAQWEVTDTSTCPPPTSPPPSHLKDAADEQMSGGEAESAPESESEQDEESTGSMGSAAVALDPVEKEWIYSAAGARVPQLTQLLREDPSLANKKVIITFTALHWAAKHGNQDMAALVAEAGADVNTKSVRTSPLKIIIIHALHGTCEYLDHGNKTAGFSSMMSLPQTVQLCKRMTEAPFFDKVSGKWLRLCYLVRVHLRCISAPQGYTPLHIAALHGHQHILDLLVRTYGAKENLRDYSGHLAGHYLNIKEAECPEEECEPPSAFQVTQARERNRNRKLVSLFHSKKKWGSAEDLAPIEEERASSHQLALPPFRPRKFSR
ncbi:ankyrin repeat domain-containing protein SOWAHA [Synchiropus splendidus]|uniref:ankyrin repeat domain-containing protein SOWAHA n=1 Tax=Synchiropus splendidus TaxID=270530 RepID=UPI00237EC65E|nr:ankyrin repeat domain-containing protein SOWAHA [Synchiropus splendidus]